MKLIYSLFSKRYSKFQAKMPKAIRNLLSRIVWRWTTLLGQIPQPSPAALAQSQCYTLHGGYKMGRKHRGEGGEKSRGWRKEETKAYRIILWLLRCPPEYSLHPTVPPLAHYRAQKYNFSVLCRSLLRPCFPEIKFLVKLWHTESFCLDHKEQAYILCWCKL